MGIALNSSNLIIENIYYILVSKKKMSESIEQIYHLEKTLETIKKLEYNYF